MNSRGLKPNQILQMDVTHVSESGWSKCVHVNMGTYSCFIFASAQTKKSAKHVINHCLSAFAVMGKPQQIKTAFGPVYIFQVF